MSLSQKDVDNIDKLNEYLANRKNYERRLYHYTNVSNLIKIIKSGQLLLNNIHNVNDAIESQDCKSRQLYVASFTYNIIEQVHYWSIYGKQEPYSVRISFDYQDHAEEFTSNVEFKTKDGQPIHANECRISDVVYYNRNSKKVSEDNGPSPNGRRMHWKHNGSFFKLYDDIDAIKEQLPGLCKYHIWEHEKETRFLIWLDEVHNAVFYTLPKTFFETMTVTFNPWMDEAVREEFRSMLIDLIERTHGIKKPKSSIKRSSIQNMIKL